MTASPDVRGALRSLRRSPGYVLLASVTLGLGAGAAGATFALVDQVILKPLPVSDESSVIVAWGSHRTRDFDHFPFSHEAWTRIAEGASGVERVAATDAWGWTERLVEDGYGLSPVRWSRVLGDFFGVLDVSPVLGRTLLETDDVRGGPRVAVVSHGLWQRRWGGDGAVLGATLTVDGQPHMVVGVLPPEFDYPRGTEVWTPTMTQYGDSDAGPPRLELDLLARLAADASPGRLSAEIERVVMRAPALREVYGDVDPVVRPWRDVMLGDMRPVVLLLFGGALLLLAVAAVNAGNLVLVRAGDRSGGWAIRRALGANRRQLTIAPLVEAAVITAIASLVAVMVMRGSLGALIPLAPEGVQGLDGVRPGASTWITVAAVLTGSAVLLALLPVVRAPRSLDGGGILRSGTRVEPRRRRGRAIVITGQAALALWAVAAAALLVRSLSNLQALDTGFEADGLHIVQIDHDHGLFAVPADWPDRVSTAADLIARDPSIVSATPVLSPPLIGNGGFDVVPTAVGDMSPDAALPYMNFDVTLPGYFATLGLRIVRGRATDGTDVAGGLPAAVVNEEAARALWPGEDAIGRQFGLPFPGYEDVAWTVVGVAADSRYRAFPDMRPSLYVPLRQMPIIAGRWIAVRTVRPTDVAGAVEAAFASTDPGVRVVGAASVLDRMAAPLSRPRFALAVLSAIASVILLLAAIGAYGVMAAGVRGRTRELGVRMACGAAPLDVGRLVLGEGLVLAAAGIAIGGVASVLTGRWIDALLFGVRAGDPVGLGVAATIVLATAVAASLSPAYRAATTDPLTVLRAVDE